MKSQRAAMLSAVKLKFRGLKTVLFLLLRHRLCARGRRFLKIVLALQILMRRAEYLRILDAHAVLKEIP